MKDLFGVLPIPPYYTHNELWMVFFLLFLTLCILALHGYHFPLLGVLLLIHKTDYGDFFICTSLSSFSLLFLSSSFLLFGSKLNLYLKIK